MLTQARRVPVQPSCHRLKKPQAVWLLRLWALLSSFPLVLCASCSPLLGVFRPPSLFAYLLAYWKKAFCLYRVRTRQMRFQASKTPLNVSLLSVMLGEFYDNASHDALLAVQ